VVAAEEAEKEAEERAEGVEGEEVGSDEERLSEPEGRGLPLRCMIIFLVTIWGTLADELGTSDNFSTGIKLPSCLDRVTGAWADGVATISVT